MNQTRTKRFTGRHMAAILVAGFGVVIAVNVLMATLASTSFGGVVVENSYVAGQHFNDWLDKAEASRAMGYDVSASRAPDGRVVLRTQGVPAGSKVSALARHPLGHQPDTALTFTMTGADSWTSATPLAEGRWTLRFAIDGPDGIWRGERALP